MLQFLAHGTEEVNAPLDWHDYLIMAGALVVVLAIGYAVRSLHKD